MVFYCERRTRLKVSENKILSRVLRSKRQLPNINRINEMGRTCSMHTKNGKCI